MPSTRYVSMYSVKESYFPILTIVHSIQGGETTNVKEGNLRVFPHRRSPAITLDSVYHDNQSVASNRRYHLIKTILMDQMAQKRLNLLLPMMSLFELDLRRQFVEWTY